jgi:hypothetical protein
VPLISFIVSTHLAADLARLETNLEATVDASYEIIPVANPGRYSLAEAYNIGARKARGAFLCFVHEDVVFCDAHWDIPVVERFALRPNLGLLGVAGSVVHPDLPIGFFLGYPNLDRSTFRHLNDRNTVEEVRCPYPEEECEVRVLDGVLLFARREAWERFPFDENVRGFHFYDVDFSFRIAQHYRIEVAPKLMLEHISTSPRYTPKGHQVGYNANWVAAALEYEPCREGLKFDELDPAMILKIKRMWFAYVCMPGCPFGLRWKYWRCLELPLAQSYFGLPVVFPGLFNFIKSEFHELRRIKQQRHYERTQP